MMLNSVMSEATGIGVSPMDGVPLRICGGVAEAALGTAVLAWAIVRTMRRPSAPSTGWRRLLWPGPPTRGLAVVAGALGVSVMVWGLGEALPGRPGHIVQLIATAMTVLSGLAAAVTFPPDPSELGEDASRESAVLPVPAPALDHGLVGAGILAADSSVVGLDVTAP